MIVEYINSKWSIPARFSVLAVLFILPSAIQLTAYVRAKIAEIHTAELEAEGAYVGKLAWSYFEKAGHGQSVEISPELRAAVVKSDWPKAQKAFADLEKPASGIERIAKATGLLEEIADAAGMNLDPAQDTFVAQDAVMFRLPHLRVAVEDAHEAVRAGAEPFVVAGAMAKIDAHVVLVQASLVELQSLATLPGFNAQLATGTESLVQQAASIRQDAKTDGYQTSNIAKDFDAKISKVSEAIVGVANVSNEYFIQATDQRIGSMRTRLAWSAGILCFLTVFGGFVALLVSRGFSSRIGDLVSVMQRITQRDLDVQVPHTSDANENGTIARALEVFRLSLVENGAMSLAAAKVAQAQNDESQYYAREHETFMDAFTRAADRIAQGDFSHRILEKVIPEYEAIIEQMNIMMGRLESAAREKEDAERNIHEVVDGLGAALAELARGNLETTMAQDVTAEFERLKVDFNSAVSELCNTISQVKTAAENIKVGTDEISQASDDLSRRTENQAASLEQTAAAVKEITVTVNRTAEGATLARQTVSVAKSDAEKSGEIVRKAVAAMNAIENSSKQISQIIGVIDEIAFQTNLLALNAGVEAARAGDAGRGFAVVASEVRALAQRSADAAKEIKGLISASTAQVAQGVRLVGETGDALTRIVAQVNDINQVVTNIALSASEQAHGLGQVNTAVNEMDQVTQQNAAMVEEATAATQTLSRQTDELARLVSRFNTNDHNIAELRPRRENARSNGSAPSKYASKAKAASGGNRSPAPLAATGTDAGWEEF